MKKDLTLVILAAGMGSRFGGLKQIEPIGPNGEFIIDYSVYDAIRAGFTKVVFIIKEEMYDVFHKTIGQRINNHIEVSYVFQDIKNVPNGVNIPLDRVKPWGTGHAVLSSKEYVSGNFVMINADDFYGADAYQKIKKFFDQSNEPNTYCMVGFRTINTMTENGSVKRGVCESENSYLTNIIESNIEKTDNKIIASPLDGRTSFEIDPNSLVSMNFFGFTNLMYKTLEDGIKSFFEKNKDDLSKCEYLIPDVVETEIKNNKRVYVLESADKWLGVTYKEDKKFVKDEINKLIKEGKYPNNLWQ